MVWFATAVAKSMSLEKGPSKLSQITTNISTILNALDVGKPIFYSLLAIHKRIGERNNPKGGKP
jgi:hypothetical protein